MAKQNTPRDVFFTLKLTKIRLCRAFAMAGVIFTGALVAMPSLPGRGLTEPETDMLKDIFRDSIKYEDVKIHSSKFYDAIATDGFEVSTHENTMFYTSLDYEEDLSKKGLVGTFIHEATHVWQNQNCQEENPLKLMLNKVQATFNLSPEDNYEYTLEKGKDLTEYHAEHQAAIIADYYYYLQRGIKSPLWMANSRDYTAEEIESLYQSTLKNFMADPSYAKKDCTWINKFLY